MSTTERDHLMAEDFLDGKDLDQLASENGLSRRRVQQILTARGVRAKDRRVKRVRGQPPSPRSGLHQRIGLMFYETYMVERQMTRAEVAAELGLSSQAIRGIELGTNPLELLILQDVAAFMKKSVGELIDAN